MVRIINARRSVIGQLTWLGQAGFLLETLHTRLVIDCFLTPTPGVREPFCTVQDLGPIDYALVSHEHRDHLDGPTLRQLRQENPGLTVIVPESIQNEVTRWDIPEAAMMAARPGEALQFGDGFIHPIASAHGVDVADGYGVGDPPGRFLGYVVSWDGFSLYHSGDTVWYPGLVPSLESLGVVAALLPINGRSFVRESENVVGNLNPEEAAWLAYAMGVSWWAPMHYDTYPNNLGDIGAAAVETRRRGVPMIIPQYGLPIPLISPK